MKVVLKGRDGTRCAGKGGLHVCKGLIRWLAGSGQLGRRTEVGEGSPDVALRVYKALPNAIGRGDAEIDVQVAQSLSRIAEADNEFQECPQRLGTEACPPVFIVGPDAGSESATVVALLADVAEDPKSAARSQFAGVLVVAVQLAVEN